MFSYTVSTVFTAAWKITGAYYTVDIDSGFVSFGTVITFSSGFISGNDTFPFPKGTSGPLFYNI